MRNAFAATPGERLRSAIGLRVTLLLSGVRYCERAVSIAGPLRYQTRNVDSRPVERSRLPFAVDSLSLDGIPTEYLTERERKRKEKKEREGGKRREKERVERRKTKKERKKERGERKEEREKEKEIRERKRKRLEREKEKERGEKRRE